MSEEKTLALNYYRDECGRAYTQYRKTKELYEAHKHEWEYWRSRYEALDRELALTDGRLRICPCGKKEKVPAKPPELTKEQLLAIAEKLGIEIKEPDQEKFIIIEEEDERMEKMKLDPEYIPERVFMDYCPWCDEETPIEIVDEKPGHEPTGLLKSQLLECQNCETRWWI